MAQMPLPARPEAIAVLSPAELAALERYKGTYAAASILGVTDHDPRARRLVWLRYLRRREKLES